MIEKKFDLQLKNETRFGLLNLNIDLFNKNNQLWIVKLKIKFS